jgi:Uma2 family endonuclease
MRNGALTVARRRSPAATEHSSGGEPAWEVALCLPPQGEWTEEDYLEIERLRHEHFPLLELSNGRLEVRPMPTFLHQMIQRFMIRMLEEFAAENAPGFVVSAGYKLRFLGGHRQPDIIYIRKEHAEWILDNWCTGADLAIEIVSADPKDQKRDYKDKVGDYARAGVAEYWLIDPKHKKVTVLTLKGKKYKRHGVFKPGKSATSVLLDGFSVPVTQLLNPPMLAEKE